MKLKYSNDILLLYSILYIIMNIIKEYYKINWNTKLFILKLFIMYVMYTIRIDEDISSLIYTNA